MTRQSIYALFHQLPHKHIILPRFVPAGVYEPVRETQKKIFYYDVPNSLTIDTAFVRSLALDPSETIFYHIHQFGLFIEQNVEFAKEMQRAGYFVIDDRSLTLPSSTYSEFGDATAYSFYKLVGIPFGGQVRLKRSDDRARHTTMNELDAQLMKKMRQYFLFYANPVALRLPALPFRVYNRLFCKYIAYNHLVGKQWLPSPSQLPSRLEEKIMRIDFDSITARRITIARQYYQGLRAELRLPVPMEAYSHQSIMAFPILVSDPFKLHKQLLRKGIFTFQFTKIWWWDPTRDYCDLYKRNLLLPAHHRLRESDAQYIIDCVNEIAA